MLLRYLVAIEAVANLKIPTGEQIGGVGAELFLKVEVMVKAHPSFRGMASHMFVELFAYWLHLYLD
jgi:hypothetical protein